MFALCGLWVLVFGVVVSVAMQHGFDFVCGLPMDFGWFGQIAAERQVGGVAMWCCIWFVVFIVAILWFCAMWLLVVGFGVVSLCVGV